MNHNFTDTLAALIAAALIALIALAVYAYRPHYPPKIIQDYRTADTATRVLQEVERDQLRK